MAKARAKTDRVLNRVPELCLALPDGKETLTSGKPRKATWWGAWPDASSGACRKAVSASVRRRWGEAARSHDLGAGRKAADAMVRLALFLAAACTWPLAACDRDAAAPRASTTAAAPEVRREPPPPALVRHPAGERLVAIGDLHGDLQAARGALRLAGAIDAQDRWSGGRLVVVQTGDQLDRGDDERAIVDLFERLSGEARAAGGAVIALNGNHETMNVQGDFRYVTPAGFRTFGDVQIRAPGADRFPERERARAAAFLPGGEYAMKLANRDVVAIVADTAFAHGGLLPEHVAYGIERLNQEVRSWMRGTTPLPPRAIAHDEAPVWSRRFGGHTDTATCEQLARVLRELGVRRLVIGHTIQQSGISAACEDRVFRIDVGMSRYYGNNPIAVLEITKAGVKPLSASRESLLGAPGTEAAPLIPNGGR